MRTIFSDQKVSKHFRPRDALRNLDKIVTQENTGFSITFSYMYEFINEVIC